MIFRNWKSKGEYKANCAKQEQDINRLNERIDDSENVEAIQLGIIDRLKAENNEICSRHFFGFLCNLCKSCSTCIVVLVSEYRLFDCKENGSK